MTISKEMLASAAKAVQLLGEARAAEIGEFYRRLLRPDGGFADRAGKSDLYYTVFGLQAFRALGAEPPAESVRSYLRGFGTGEKLDMVHLGCLARCWATLDGEACPPHVRSAVLTRIEACRSADGGYAQQPARPAGSAYGCFLALGACQDLGADLPDADGAARCLAGLAVGNGSYANDASMPIGSVPATAAAVTVLAHLENRDANHFPPSVLHANRDAKENRDANHFSPPALHGNGDAKRRKIRKMVSVPIFPANGDAKRRKMVSVPIFPIFRRAADWLLAQHDPAGGFRAVPVAPEPDMLSTAVALQTLRKLDADISAIRPGCIEFCRSLLANGRFAGHAGDTALDGEYTFYGLLALGCLEE
jgi:hypothetical protein